MDKQERKVRSSFLLEHRGTQLWVENLNDLNEEGEIAVEIFLKDQKSMRMLQKPEHIVINLENTIIHPQIARLICWELKLTEELISKVAFVSTDAETMKSLTWYLTRYHVFFAFRFFTRFKVAKEWLV